MRNRVLDGRVPESTSGRFNGREMMRTLRSGLVAAVAAAMFVGCAVAQSQDKQGADRAPAPDRPRRAQSAHDKAVQEFIDRAPLPKDDDEKKILAVLDDMYRNQRKGMMNIQLEDGRFLRLITEAVNAKHVVEIGTSNGYSGIWFCLALRKTGGKLTTHEIDEGRAALARKNFARAGVDKRVTLVMGDAHQEVLKLKEPIDVLFLDADKPGYIDYLNKLLPLVRPGGLILAHNTSNLGQAMKSYLDAVTKNPDLETLFVHRHDQGIGVTLKKR
ncbi:MAG: O-methyltransferase [Phycisphaerae bacterium]|nr:O-methyltransferase [Phycisphaerae bacterium]